MSIRVKAVGYNILVKPYAPPERMSSGLIRPVSTVQHETIASVVAQVLDMGDGAYTDETKTPGTTPWCKVGDWVIIGKLQGVRFKVDNEEYRFVNDDSILGIADDPENVTRT